jgi:hypothetical protein
MEMLSHTMPTVAVATIYCIWSRAYVYLKQQRLKVLRDRVTYMLWVMANEVC